MWLDGEIIGTSIDLFPHTQVSKEKVKKKKKKKGPAQNNVFPAQSEWQQKTWSSFFFYIERETVRKKSPWLLRFCPCSNPPSSTSFRIGCGRRGRRRYFLSSSWGEDNNYQQLNSEVVSPLCSRPSGSTPLRTVERQDVHKSIIRARPRNCTKIKYTKTIACETILPAETRRRRRTIFHEQQKNRLHKGVDASV